MEGDSVIFITGDCHQDFQRFNSRNFPEQKKMTKNDYVIICGDFGGVWNRDKESKEENSLMNWLDGKPFTTLFVDGNHENFDRLYSYPIEEWHGGKVHKIRPSVIHLMRGQVFEIDGKSIFTFGGAGSHDIDDGILEPDAPDFKKKKRELDRKGRLYRVNHVSWWKQELPSEEEMEEGRKNLASHDNKVDFLVTHCCASSTQALLNSDMYKPDVETDYLEEIRKTIKFKKWFFGHYHDNKNVSAEEILLYEQLIPIP
jgi:predicted phosphodiesterase